MKVAASDYDGTLFLQETICKEIIVAIRNWRDAGGKFGVVTGRDFGMLVPQLQYYQIVFDFAVCNNGGIIFDQAGSVLFQSRIATAVLQAVAVQPCVADSLHFSFSAAEGTYICHERPGSWIDREAKEWKFPLYRIREDAIGKLEGIHQFSLGFTSADQSRAVSKRLNELFGSVIHAYPNRGSLDITPVEVSKRQGLEQLIRCMGWKAPKLFVIGDESNDLPMLEAFGGYTVDSARPEIKEKAKASFPNVGAMLENFITGDQFDSVMNYKLSFALGDLFLNRGDAQAADDELKVLRQNYPKEALYDLMNIVDSHDTMRAIYKFGGGKDNVAQAARQDFKYALGKARLKLAAAFLMGYPGMPTIYYGDEAGQYGSADPDCRRTYPWGREDKDLIEYYRQVIGVRNSHKQLFAHGDIATLKAAGDIYAFARTSGNDGAVVALNRGKAVQEVLPAGPFADGTSFVDALDADYHTVVAGNSLTVELGENQARMLIEE